MSDWTAERLDALPFYTIIKVTYRGGIDGDMTRGVRGWHGPMPPFTSKEVMERAVSIRVVAVPIAALLSKEAIKASEVATYAAIKGEPYACGSYHGIRAALHHITGEVYP